MEEERLLRTCSSAFRIPATLFQGKAPDSQTSQSHASHLALYLRSCLPETLPPLWYAGTPELLLFGGVRLPENEDRILILGPVLPVSCTPALIRELLSRLRRPEQDFFVLREELEKCPLTDSFQLKNMLILIYSVLYREEVPDPEWLSFQWADLFPAGEILIPASDDVEDSSLDWRPTLSSCLKYGQVEEMKKYLTESVISIQTDMDLVTRRTYISGANSFGSQTAILSGAPEDTLNMIADRYFEMIRQTSSAEEMDRIFFRFMVEYTEQIRKVRMPLFSTPFTREIHTWIQAHIYEHISTREVAQGIHRNENYICARFRQETGITVQSHIRFCKMEQAKYLLSTGRYSVSEVSDLLVYSTQSYFAQVFRQATGKTPTQFLEEQKQNMPDWGDTKEPVPVPS